MTLHNKNHITKDRRTWLGKIPHSSYSPDLAPSDHDLFQSLQNHLEETAIAMQEDVETDICEFFESKPKELYSGGINKLFNRWKEVIDNQEKYIND